MAQRDYGNNDGDRDYDCDDDKSLYGHYFGRACVVCNESPTQDKILTAVNSTSNSNPNGTQTGSNTFGLPPLSASGSTTSPSSGSQSGKIILPLLNPNVNRSDINNLIPSSVATLQYAEPVGSGTYAASLQFAMISPQVTLENSEYVIDLARTGNIITITLQNAAAFAVALQ